MDNSSEEKLSVRELFALELKKLEAEETWRKRTHELQVQELNFKLEEAKRARLTNPLILAVLGAFVAGLFSIAAQYITAENQSNSEQSRHNNQLAAERQRQPLNMELEAFKADAARIIEAVKITDLDKASCNLSFLVATGLITTPTLRASITSYLGSRYSSQNTDMVTLPSVAGPPATMTPRPPPSPSGRAETAHRLLGCGPPERTPAAPMLPPVVPPAVKPAPEIVQFETDWMSGGHNQQEACATGIARSQPRFPNRQLTVISSREEFRWAFLRKAQYKYYCTIQVE